MTTDPREALLAKVAALRAGRPPVHVGGRLVDTPEGVRLDCPRCQRLLTAEEWAADCPGAPEAKPTP